MIFFTITGLIVWGCIAILAVWYYTGRLEITREKGNDD